MIYELHFSDFISDEDIRSYASQNFVVGLEQVQLCDSLDEMQECEICIVKTLREGDFPYTLQFYVPDSRAKFHEEELARNLCEKFALSCLVPDDSTNPYGWLQIDQNRRYTEVLVSPEDLDQKGIFVIAKTLS